MHITVAASISLSRVSGVITAIYRGCLLYAGEGMHEGVLQNNCTCPAVQIQQHAGL